MPTSTLHPVKRKSKVITTIRLDPDIKRQGQIITKNMGIDLSTFFTMKLTELVQSRKTTISLSDDESTEYLSSLSKDADILEDSLPSYSPTEFLSHLRSL